VVVGWELVVVLELVWGLVVVEELELDVVQSCQPLVEEEVVWEEDVDRVVEEVVFACVS
jgi:hypothetical protein